MRKAEIEEGGFYLNKNGLWVREATQVSDGNVWWRDRHGPGMAQLRVFAHAVSKRVERPDDYWRWGWRPVDVPYALMEWPL